jgi:hypothetical protein
MYGYGAYAEVRNCILESGDIVGIQKIYGP